MSHSTHTLIVPIRSVFPMGYRLPDVLDFRNGIQWYMLSGADEIVPIRIMPVPESHKESVLAIQRAYRDFVHRRREAKMLALCMSQHPRLGEHSPAGAAGADVLAVINRHV